jgi:hypothetical protein
MISGSTGSGTTQNADFGEIDSSAICAEPVRQGGVMCFQVVAGFFTGSRTGSRTALPVTGSIGSLPFRVEPQNRNRFQGVFFSEESLEPLEPIGRDRVSVRSLRVAS